MQPKLEYIDLKQAIESTKEAIDKYYRLAKMDEIVLRGFRLEIKKNIYQYKKQELEKKSSSTP